MITRNQRKTEPLGKSPSKELEKGRKKKQKKKKKQTKKKKKKKQKKG